MWPQSGVGVGIARCSPTPTTCSLPPGVQCSHRPVAPRCTLCRPKGGVLPDAGTCQARQAVYNQPTQDRHAQDNRRQTKEYVHVLLHAVAKTERQRRRADAPLSRVWYARDRLAAVALFSTLTGCIRCSLRGIYNSVLHAPAHQRTRSQTAAV